MLSNDMPDETAIETAIETAMGFSPISPSSRWSRLIIVGLSLAGAGFEPVSALADGAKSGMFANRRWTAATE